MSVVQLWQQARNSTNSDLTFSGQHGLCGRHRNQEYVTCSVVFKSLLVLCTWYL